MNLKSSLGYSSDTDAVNDTLKQSHFAPAYNGITSDKRPSSAVAEDTPLVPPDSGGYSTRQRRLLVGMNVVSVLNGSLMALMIPFFPVEASRRGVSQTAISGVFSCFALTQVVLYPLVGPLALRFGVTRLYNAGIAVAGVSTVAFGLIFYIPGSTGFIAACFVARMVEAAGTAAVSACSFTIIGNQFAERTSSAVAMVSAAQSVGLSVAPAVGGGLYAAAGFGLPFYVLGAAMIVTALINAQFMPAVVKQDDAPVNLLRTVRLFIGSYENWLCMVIVFSYTVAFVTFSSCAAPYADAVLGITPATLGLYFTVAAGSYVVTSFLWAWLAERAANPYPVMALCVLIVVGSQLLIPPAPWLGLQPRWWLFGLGMTLQEAFYGGAYIPCFQLMMAATLRTGLPDDLRTHAFISGVYWSMYSLGTVVGPLVGGVLVDAFGFPLMMTVMAGETLLVMLLTAAQAAVRACE
ncbi:MFS-type transporter SLC18B1-like [Amphibalanus amphitrite]|uniref:MFS-type transporter SLC18B1-like n=1 Tax=Amphibalanus amphitrite TaxID=1232801 RepID=UPI001C9247EF|nr:MFS-type transporter SLC18B1-like [Amphibalanus amphitrite]